jgi:excisionase family DNA binding protein
MMIGMEEILTVQQAARYCRVSAKTIINWVEAGHIPAFKTVGGHRRIQRPDLVAFMQRQGIPLPDDPPKDSGRYRILVVDDDPVIVESIVQALEDEGDRYRVAAAANGFEAGIQVTEFNPHLVILDIMMPDINGLEVCRRIKTSKRTRDIHIIVLSAYLDTDKFERLIQLGADACFSKPLPLQRLKTEIARLLDPPPASS